VFGEQVASKIGREWLIGVFADLEGMGYAAAGADLCAASVGAPHARQRLWWVADAGHKSERGWPEPGGQELTSASDRGELGLSYRAGLEGTNDYRGKPERIHSVPSESGGELVYTTGRGCPQSDTSFTPEQHDQANPWRGATTVQCADGKARRIRPGIAPVAHGIPARVVRIRGYGNAIVPQVAAQFILAYMECKA